MLRRCRQVQLWHSRRFDNGLLAGLLLRDALLGDGVRAPLSGDLRWRLLRARGALSRSLGWRLLGARGALGGTLG